MSGNADGGLGAGESPEHLRRLRTELALMTPTLASTTEDNPMLRSFSVLTLCFAAAPGLAQVKPDVAYFEIDADGGSRNGRRTIPYGYTQLSSNIIDGGHFTFAPKQGYKKNSSPRVSACSDWFHQRLSAYTGLQAYRVVAMWPSNHVQSKDDGKEPRRSEQMLLKHWYTGKDSTRYFSLAFRFSVYKPKQAKSDGFIAQWHQGGSGPPPILLAWEYDNGQYYLASRIYSDNATKSPKPKTLFRKPAIPGKWYRMLWEVNLGPQLGQSYCPKCPTPLGKVRAWMMNNQTGLWESWGTYAGQVGYKYNYKKPGFRTGSDLGYQFKVGYYKGEIEHVTQDYDNVAYASRWNYITKNRTIGYHRNIVHLNFDERGGATAYDQSATFNKGWGYSNNGELRGPARQLNVGVRGSCLGFDGRDDHVRVPIRGNPEFDTGNYLSLSTWFRTSSSQANKGLLTVDEYSTTYKSKLFWTSNNTIDFNVRHPDNTISRVTARLPRGLNDNKWHHVAATYNRWAKYGRRMKIYVDGKLVGIGYAAHKPLMQGKNYLYVGKFSGGYFRGSMDEPMLFNFELSHKQIAELASWYTSGELKSFGAGCVGTNGRLVHSASGTPEVGKRIYYRASGGPAGGLALFSLGFSKTKWGPITLPLKLDFLGARGCSLYSDPLFLLALPLNRSGQATLPWTLASSRAFIGTRHFTQFMAIDPRASAWGITYSNGVETFVGGHR